MIQKYIEPMTRVPAICDEFKEAVRRNFFSSTSFVGAPITIPFQSNEYYCFSPLYRDYFEGLRRIIEICDAFGIPVLEHSKGKLTQAIGDLANPDTVRTWANVESRLDLIRQIFNLAQPEVGRMYSLLRKEEVDRLDEAIHDVLEGCNYSATAMAVTAIEFRLLRLMQKKTPSEKLDELTLGQLVNKALTDKNYAGLVPEKHQALLELCNTYRVFSVHAKTEKITKALALSTLNLTIAFLTDESLMVKEG